MRFSFTSQIKSFTTNKHNQCSDGITDNLELGIKNKNAALIP